MSEFMQMKGVLLIASVLLAGCGVETASTAATAAALKKQEIEQAQKNQQQFQQNLDVTTRQMQQRADQAGNEK